MENKNLSIIVRVVAGIMLLLALGSWPYSYYQLLRIVICGSSFFLVWYFINVKIEWLGWLFIIPGILFNPLFPFYLDKQLWQLLDIVFSLQFLASLGATKWEKAQ